MAMTPDEIRRKIEDLARRTETFNNKRASLGGKIQAKKDELAQLILEVNAAGYNPKTLREERDKAQATLEEMVASYEKTLVAAETAIAGYDLKK